MPQVVLGPGARGVVVVADDPGRAVRDRLALERAGIPAATADELGLRLPPPPDGRDRAGRWATALRRPVVARRGESLRVAGPGKSVSSPDPRSAAEAARGLLERRPGPRVAIFGGAWVEESEPEHEEARRLGALLARRRLEVVSGGYGGVMAAVSRGAAEAGGVAVGVTIEAWSEGLGGNRWLTHEVVARDLFSRLPLIFDAEAWVAFSGGAGTLAEIALGWNLVQTRSVEPRPLLLVGERWRQALDALRPLLLLRDPADFELLRLAEDAESAGEEIARLLGA